MSTKLKVNTKVQTMQDVQKSLIEIEKNFNTLLTRINSPAEKELPGTQGETGDIQISENPDKSFTFEVKTKTGWKTPVIGKSAIKFKDKPKVKDVPKSIDEIEATDTSTGSANAKKTIYDEKNDKFVLPRPDYESAWTSVAAANNYDFDHNLGLQEFKLVSVIVKFESRIYYPIWEAGYGPSGDDYGIFPVAETDNRMNIGIGNHGIYISDNTFHDTTAENMTSGVEIKLRIWK